MKRFYFLLGFLLCIHLSMNGQTGYIVPMVNFTADTAAGLWKIEGLGVSQNASYVDTLGSRCIRIQLTNKSNWVGLWYNFPTELNLSKAPYISYEISAIGFSPLMTHVYFWDTNFERNSNGAHWERDTITDNISDFHKVFADFRKPGYLDNDPGNPIDTTRISNILFNYHNIFKWPNTNISGTVYIRNIRVGVSIDILDSTDNPPGANECREKVTYHTAMINDTLKVNWSLPFGVSGSSDSSSIMVTYPDYDVSGYIKAGYQDYPEIADSFYVSYHYLAPLAGMITGDTLFCRGNSAVYSVSPAAGATKYNWMLPTGAAAIGDTTGDTIKVLFNQPFDMIPVKVHAQNTVYCKSNIVQSDPVTVNTTDFSMTLSPPDTQVILTASMQITFLNNTPGFAGYDFKWDFGDGGTDISNSNPTSYTYAVNGTYNIVLSARHITTGCEDTLTRSVICSYLAPTGNISGNSSFCDPATGLFYTAPATGATKYKWTIPTSAVIIGSDTTDSISVKFTSIFAKDTIKVQALNKYAVSSIQSKAIAVYTSDFGMAVSPSGTQLLTVSPMKAMFFNNTVNRPDYNFKWDFSDGSIDESNVNPVQHNYTKNGTYDVILTAINKTTGCNDTLLLKEAVYCSGESGILSPGSGIQLFPNPAGDHVDISGIIGPAVVTLHNLSGQIISQKNTSAADITLDLTGLAKGCYLISIKTVDNRVIKRLIKE